MSQSRLLRDDEKALLAALISKAHGPEHLVKSLSDCRVEEMNDGGMGSLRFSPQDGQPRHSVIRNRHKEQTLTSPHDKFNARDSAVRSVAHGDVLPTGTPRAAQLDETSRAVDAANEQISST